MIISGTCFGRVLDGTQRIPYELQQADRRDMIARVHVILPFHLVVPEGREFKLHPYDDERASS